MLANKPRELPKILRESDLSSAFSAILDLNVAAATAPFGQELKSACQAYEQFALKNKLHPKSPCYYQLADIYDDTSNYVCFSSRNELLEDSQPARHADECGNDLSLFFKTIGFRDHDTQSADTIIKHVLDGRSLLANLFPGQTLQITTNIYVGSSVPVLHFHDDIAFGITICGPTTYLMNPEQVESYSFESTDFLVAKQAVATNGPQNWRAHIDGLMSVSRHHFLLFKGARGKDLAFGHPDNIGAVHSSPQDEQSIDGTPIPRMFIASFIRPPGWENMKLHNPYQKKRPAFDD